MPPKQCTCGRSQSYPYCDGTHKVVKAVREEMAKEIVDFITKGNK